MDTGCGGACGELSLAVATSYQRPRRHRHQHPQRRLGQTRCAFSVDDRAVLIKLTVTVTEIDN